ncbi:hypothetical protein ABZ421_39695, partial [Streptomyces sp. NPDC005859]
SVLGIRGGSPVGPSQANPAERDVSPKPDREGLAVDAAVNVACWCNTEHATHDIDAVRVDVDDETSLVSAFRAGTDRLTGWLADPRDADHWRARAGLPVR